MQQLTQTPRGRAAQTLILLVLLGATLATGACARKGGYPGGGQGGFAFPVAAEPITRGAISQYASTTGAVVPRLTGDLSSVASGTVLTVSAQVGQHVTKGELLVQIDDSTLRAQESQAAANLAQLQASSVGGSSTAQASLASAKVAYQTAQVDLQRNRTLYAQGYVSKSALDDSTNRFAAADAALRSAEVAEQNASLSSAGSAAVAQIQSAQAALATVQREIALAHVTAPFDGTVTARNVDPGSLAAPGTVLMSVSQLDPVFIDTTIAGSDLSVVRVGTPVNVTVSGVDGRTWHGSVRYLNLAADPGTSVYKARIPISNSDLMLRGGMVANVQYAQSTKNNVLLAPRAAVYQTPAGYGMFIIDDKGMAQQIDVQVGIENDQVAEVSGPGLKPGVKAILNHSVLLQPGTPVQVMPPPGSQPGSKPAQTAHN